MSRGHREPQACSSPSLPEKHFLHLATARPLARLRSPMSSFDIVIGGVLVALASFQIWLTVRVFRSRLFERKQKIMQAQLIWLLPIIGAGLVFTILQEEERSQKPPTTQLKA